MFWELGCVERWSSKIFDSEFSGVLENVLGYMNIECYVYVVVWSRSFFETIEMETKNLLVCLWPIMCFRAYIANDIIAII